VIIPARFASERLPGKVLLDQTGLPMIAHVIERAMAAAIAERVVVATDDERIFAAARDAGAEPVMTASDHPNGTARIAEACALLGLDEACPVINVQGDEPEMDPAIINAVGEELLESGADVATAAGRFAVGADRVPEDLGDPNIVKVVIARDLATESGVTGSIDAARSIRIGDSGRALYFSRAPIPHARDGGVSPGAEALRHIGIYGYRAGFVSRYASWPSTPLEQSERLEQLRVLERGGTIAVRVVGAVPHGIDTAEQYAAFVYRHMNQSTDV
jgi:3-deoxy-manno-octulosonate cytidylyltransferase (CMP-KDO synthetase)